MEWDYWRIVTVTGWVQVDYQIVVIALEAEGQSEWGQKRLQPQCDYLRTPNSLSRLSSSSFKIPISLPSAVFFLLTSLNHHTSPFSSSTFLHRSLSLRDPSNWCWTVTSKLLRRGGGSFLVMSFHFFEGICILWRTPWRYPPSSHLSTFCDPAAFVSSSCFRF